MYELTLLFSSGLCIFVRYHFATRYRICGVKNCQPFWPKMWTKNRQGIVILPITTQSQGQLLASSKCSSQFFSRKQRRNATGQGTTLISQEKRKPASWTCFDLDPSLMHPSWRNQTSCRKCRLVLWKLDVFMYEQRSERVCRIHHYELEF